MYEFFWFIGGAFAYKLLSKLFGLGQIVLVFQNLQYDVLKTLATVCEDISYIKALKYKTMRESNVDSEQIKKSKLDDHRFFETWKAGCISNINASLPSYIRLSFSSWEEGMSLLSDYYRRRLHEEERDEQ